MKPSKQLGQFWNSGRKGFLSLAVLVLGIAALVESIAWTSDFGPLRKKRASSGTQPLARCVSDSGTMLVKKLGSYQWRAVVKGEEFCPGDTILSGAGSQLESVSGSVRVTFRGDLAGNSPMPIRETVATILPINDEGVDFVLGFERGRLEITNLKEKGPSNVLVKLLEDQDFSAIKLVEPGSSCAMEIFGRWPKGVHFKPNQAKPVEPVYELLYVVLKGSTEVSDEGVTHVLQAPPGPALLQWNSHSDSLPVKLKLEKLPDWALPPDLNDPIVKNRLQVIMGMKLQFAEGKSVEAILGSLIQSDSEASRYIATNLLAATDMLDKLSHHVNQTKYKDVINNSVLALRHLIGRKAGEADSLYKFLVNSRQYSPAQGETFINLLRSFNNDEMSQAETYEMLLDYLESPKTGIRGLAIWHLVRLVPEGTEFNFDAASPIEMRKVAVEKWKKLIPRGKVPEIFQKKSK